MSHLDQQTIFNNRGQIAPQFKSSQNQNAAHAGYKTCMAALGWN